MCHGQAECVDKTRQRRRAALRELRSCAAGAAAARGTHAAQEEAVQHVVEVPQSEKMVATQAHHRRWS